MRLLPPLSRSSTPFVLHFRVVTCMGELCLDFTVQIQDNIWKFEKNLVQKSRCGSVPPPPVEFHRKANLRRLGCCRRRRSSTFNAARLWLPCTTFSSCNLHGFHEIFSRQLTQNIQILTKHQQKSAIVRRRSSIERPRRLSCCCRRCARVLPLMQ